MSTNRPQSSAANAPRCPSGWRTSAQNSQECFPECPAGYTFKNPGTGVMENGRIDPNPSCVFNSDPKYYVAVPNVNINRPAADFTSARATLNGNIDAKNAEIGRQTLLNAAKEAIFNAENGRSSNPDGYQQARVNYYTLLQGQGWMNTETQRVGIEVDREINTYRERILSLSKRLDAQTQYSDIIRNTSDRVLQAKDDLQFMVDSFAEQLDKINVEKEKQTREATERVVASFEWIDTLLNWAIIIALVFAIGIVSYRVYQKYQYYYGKQNIQTLSL
jgi:hypothetical protein